MPSPGGPTMYRPYRTLLRGRHPDLRTLRVWGTSHHRLELAIAKAQRWHDVWVALAPESIYIFDWCVIDTRAETVVWQWKQL